MKMSGGMAMLKHYFVPFQTFLIAEAETDRRTFRLPNCPANPGRRIQSTHRRAIYFGRFVLLPVRSYLSQSSQLRSRTKRPASEDPAYPPAWQEWLLILRQLGLVDLLMTSFAANSLDVASALATSA
ncbi:MAG: hypothetical protein R3C56_24435 [Pirellulaceae bacterium]